MRVSVNTVQQTRQSNPYQEQQRHIAHTRSHSKFLQPNPSARPNNPSPMPTTALPNTAPLKLIQTISSSLRQSINSARNDSSASKKVTADTSSNHNYLLKKLMFQKQPIHLQNKKMKAKKSRNSSPTRPGIYCPNNTGIGMELYNSRQYGEYDNQKEGEGDYIDYDYRVSENEQEERNRQQQLQGMSQYDKLLLLRSLQPQMKQNQKQMAVFQSCSGSGWGSRLRSKHGISSSKITNNVVHSRNSSQLQSNHSLSSHRNIKVINSCQKQSKNDNLDQNNKSLGKSKLNLQNVIIMNQKKVNVNFNNNNLSNNHQYQSNSARGLGQNINLMNNNVNNNKNISNNINNIINQQQHQQSPYRNMFTQQQELMNNSTNKTKKNIINFQYNSNNNNVINYNNNLKISPNPNPNPDLNHINQKPSTEITSSRSKSVNNYYCQNNEDNRLKLLDIKVNHNDNNSAATATLMPPTPKIINKRSTSVVNKSTLLSQQLSLMRISNQSQMEKQNQIRKSNEIGIGVGVGIEDVKNQNSQLDQKNQKNYKNQLNQKQKINNSNDKIYIDKDNRQVELPSNGKYFVINSNDNLILPINNEKNQSQSNKLLNVKDQKQKHFNNNNKKSQKQQILNSINHFRKQNLPSNDQTSSNKFSQMDTLSIYQSNKTNKYQTQQSQATLNSLTTKEDQEDDIVQNGNGISPIQMKQVRTEEEDEYKANFTKCKTRNDDIGNVVIDNEEKQIKENVGERKNIKELLSSSNLQSSKPFQPQIQTSQKCKKYQCPNRYIQCQCQCHDSNSDWQHKAHLLMNQLEQAKRKLSNLQKKYQMQHLQHCKELQRQIDLHFLKENTLQQKLACKNKQLQSKETQFKNFIKDAKNKRHE